MIVAEILTSAFGFHRLPPSASSSGFTSAAQEARMRPVVPAAVTIVNLKIFPDRILLAAGS
jgi:hypothetical protein